MKLSTAATAALTRIFILSTKVLLKKNIKNYSFNYCQCAFLVGGKLGIWLANVPSADWLSVMLAATLVLARLWVATAASDWLAGGF